MTNRLSIKITLQNGEVMTFKDGAASHFEFQQWGTLFVEGAMEVKQKKGALEVSNHAVDITEVTYRNVRNWIPLVNIKNVEVITWKTLNDPKEIEKWQKFKEHGLDLMVTKISHTNPKTEAEVEKEIKAEEKKKARKAN